MKQQRPNILYIYPDQLRYDAIHSLGNDTIETPCMDSLINDGVCFTNAYTSFPVCCPYRASFMTGKYAHKHGLYTNHYPIDTNQEFLPQILNRNGYKTGWIGKWHLSGGRQYDFVEKELRCGFETFIGFSRGHKYDTSVFYRNDDRTPRTCDAYEPVFQTSHLFEFIDESLNEDKPFFASICYGLPHPPLIAPKEYLEYYDKDKVAIKGNVPDDTLEKAKDFTAKYYGLVKVVDEEIGKIMKALEKRGILDNTIVIMASDHGEMAGEHGRFGKIMIDEASMHVPFVIRCPEKFKAQRISNMVDPSVDIFATILDICDIKLPEYADGISLVGQMENRSDAKVKDYVYFQKIRQPFKDLDFSFPGSRGFRTHEYAYQEDEGVPSILWDLKKDPLEMNNVVNNPDYKQTVDHFHTELKAEMARLGDSFDVAYSHSLENFQGGAEAKIFVDNLHKNAVREEIKEY